MNTTLFGKYRVIQTSLVTILFFSSHFCRTCLHKNKHIMIFLLNYANCKCTTHTHAHKQMHIMHIMSMQIHMQCIYEHNVDVNAYAMHNYIWKYAMQMKIQFYHSLDSQLYCPISTMNTIVWSQADSHILWSILWSQDDLCVLWSINRLEIKLCLQSNQQSVCTIRF